MPTISAGILLYRMREGALEVLLAHPGGPFWKNKYAGAWSIPKGEAAADEPLEQAARREFEEETATEIAGPLVSLSSVKLKSGKVVHAYAAEGDCDPATCHSNLVRMELPAKSGRYVSFPEVDRVSWFTLEEARTRLHPAQCAFLDRLPTPLGRTPR